MSKVYEKPTLPLEVCELCIDALADAAKEDELSRVALTQCLHVSRVFWIMARRHIFSKVHVELPFDGRQPSVEDQLSALLAMMVSDGVALPFSITRLIKSFTLNLEYNNDNSQITNINQPSFQAILEEFLKAGVLSSLELCAPVVCWDYIDVSVQETIRSFCQTPGFRALHLRGICCISSNFWEGAWIKDLSLQDAWLGMPDPEYPSPGYIDTLSSPPELDSLTVKRLRCLPDSPASSPSSSNSDRILPFSRLGKLTSIFLHPRNIEATEVLAARASGSLHTLHLVISMICELLGPRPFDLRQLPKLRHLKLTFPTTTLNWRESQFDYLCSFIPPVLALQSLTVEISIDIHVPNLLNAKPWEVLQKCLIQSGVARVELIIKLALPTLDPETFDVDRATFIDPELFTGLQQHDAIDFTLDITYSIAVRGLPIIPEIPL